MKNQIQQSKCLLHKTIWGGEDVSGQEVRDQPGDEDELTGQEEPAHPEPDPDDASTASDAESEQSSLADGDHNLTGVNPPGGVALGRPAQGSASQKETYILFRQ